MIEPQSEFLKASQRACDEQVAAINVDDEAASCTHRRLSRLYLARALLALARSRQVLLDFGAGATAAHSR